MMEYFYIPENILLCLLTNWFTASSKKSVTPCHLYLFHLIFKSILALEKLASVQNILQENIKQKNYWNSGVF